MPRASVLIPTYNRVAYVADAIETVLDQTYRNIEALVVNDGSTDGTREMLERYTDDRRVRICHNERNRGISYSFNRAATNARGVPLYTRGRRSMAPREDRNTDRTVRSSRRGVRRRLHAGRRPEARTPHPDAATDLTR